MDARTYACQLRGLDGQLVEVQVDIGNGKPRWIFVGLAGAGVKEAAARVLGAARHSDIDFPGDRRIIVNLAPAPLRKEGPAFDLPIAVALALAARRRAAPEGVAYAGELGLDGSVRHVAGVLPMALALRRAGVHTFLVSPADADEAALVEGLRVVPAASLLDALDHVLGRRELAQVPHRVPAPAEAACDDDLAEVQGQEAARRALEIAAAGGHHLLLSGPPGAGKTMLARCLPGILPPLSLEQALEVAQVESVLGELPRQGGPLRWQRPFRTPHHSVSTAGLVGGGGGLARPGEASRAHQGVLFLDELAEFSAATLQALRQPLESGMVELTRSGGAVVYPARFQLVAATNPCPCGWLGDDRRACRCSARSVDGYRRALSGPLLDRIDLRVAVSRPPLHALAGAPTAESSAVVRRRVLSARGRQQARQGCLNAALTPAGLRRHAALGAARAALERWATEQGLTGRGVHRAWRVARTIADLAASEEVAAGHLLEALGYRLEVDRAA